MKTSSRAATVIAVVLFSVCVLLAQTPSDSVDIPPIPLPSAGGAWGAVASVAAGLLYKLYRDERRRTRTATKKKDDDAAAVKVAEIEQESALVATLMKRIADVETKSASRIAELEERVRHLEDEKRVDYEKLMASQLENERLKRSIADLEELNRQLDSDRTRLLSLVGRDRALAAGIGQ